MRDDIRTQIDVFKTCQRNKKQILKYGNLPSKVVEATPWDRFLVDLIVPYIIRKEGREEPLILKSLTMVYPETVWF